MLKDSLERYGTVSKTLHWLMTFLIAWQLLKFGDRIADGEHWVGEALVPWHVSIGSLLLVLIIVRIVWVFTQRHHRPLQDPKMAKLVKTGHGLLYAVMLLMPIAGMMAMVGGGYGVNAFGLQVIAEGDEIGWASAIGSLHAPLAWVLTVLIIGHIGMALIHHFVMKDDSLKRML